MDNFHDRGEISRSEICSVMQSTIIYGFCVVGVVCVAGVAGVVCVVCVAGVGCLVCNGVSGFRVGSVSESLGRHVVFILQER